MKRLPGLALVVFALAGSAGCATYASPYLGASADDARPREIFGAIEQLEFNKRVQVRLPAELVVADVETRVQWDRQGAADKRGVQLAGVLAAEKQTFSDVSPLLTEAGKFDDMRAAAAQHHADLMLVASMSEQVRDENGPLEGLKLLILPAALVPTETNDLALHVKAAIVDVRNNLVYATFEDHQETRIHSTAVGERDAVSEGFDRLYAASMEKMRARVAERLRTLEHGTK